MPPVNTFNLAFNLIDLSSPSSRKLDLPALNFSVFLLLQTNYLPKPNFFVFSKIHPPAGDRTHNFSRTSPYASSDHSLFPKTSDTIFSFFRTRLQQQ